MSGSVSYPAIYELKGTADDTDSALGKAIAFSGGLSPLAALQQAVIERVQSGTSLNTFDVSLDTPGLSTKLRGGDIVKVQDVVERFDNAVTLRGNVAVPRRVPWREGMTIRDLIPNKESLLTPDYWEERNQLVAARLNDAPGNPSSSDSGNEPDNANSRLDGSRRAFTQVAVQGARNDQSLASAQSNTNGLTVRKFDVRNQIQQAAPDIDWDYAVVERLEPSTLSTRLIPFHLGEVVLKGNPQQDVALKPGDVVTIFSDADISDPLERRTKFVRVEGEVENAGVYSAEAGETLRALVKRAGGITQARICTAFSLSVNPRSASSNCASTAFWILWKFKLIKPRPIRQVAYWAPTRRRSRKLLLPASAHWYRSCVKRLPPAASF